MKRRLHKTRNLDPPDKVWDLVDTAGAYTGTLKVWYRPSGARVQYYGSYEQRVIDKEELASLLRGARKATWEV